MGACCDKLKQNSPLFSSDDARDTHNQSSSSHLFSHEFSSGESSTVLSDDLQDVEHFLIKAEKLFLDVVDIVNLPYELQRLIEISSTDNGWLKIINAMINVVGIHAMNGQAENDHIGPTIIILLMEDSPLPTRELIKELHNIIEPYLVLRIHSPCDPNIIKHRNVCTILSFLAEKLAGSLSVSLLSTKIIKFFEKIIKERLNFLHVLFALNCIEKFALTRENKDTILKHMDITKELLELEKYAQPFSSSVASVYDMSSVEAVQCQVGFCAQWCLDNIFIKKGRKLTFKRVDYSNLNAILNINDKTEFLKMSPNGLSARCDSSTFECVRANFPVKSNVYFYEAIILTSGIMQIGWATKSTVFKNYEGIGVGDDTHSIAFDGCRGVIWHGTNHFKHGLSRWTAGDVVGCLIDVNNKKFIFYLNGKKVEVTKRISQKLSLIFSNEPYYAAASMMSYQHCFFNFGQMPFRYPPKKIKFNDFNSDASKLPNKEELKVIPMHIQLKSCKSSSILSKKNLCTICFDQSANVKFEPCGHEAICDKCASQCDHCPFCRQKFNYYEEIGGKGGRVYV